MKLAFIGMMGSGKTTLSNIIAKSLNLKYFSIDNEIEKANKKNINTIFNENGEEYFREQEFSMISKFSKEDNSVIDCGGGVVLNSMNIEMLKSNGYLVIFLDRDIDNIFKDIDFIARPLLRENPKKLFEIYESRIEKYKEFADIIIYNNESIEKTANCIIDLVT